MPKHKVQIRSYRYPWAYRLTAAVCVLLLSVLSLVQVTHDHSSQQSPEDSCPVCVAMHSAAPAAVAATVVAQVWQRAVPILHTPRLIAHRWHPALYNRPPPDSL